MRGRRQGIARAALGALVGRSLLGAACSSDGGDDGSAGSTSPPTDETTPDTTGTIDDVRLNELQVIGSHNSYHLAPDGGIAEGLAGLAPAFWETIDTTRRDAALASGAQYVSTDFYVERPELGTGFVVRLPGGAVVRCNPVTASDRCVDADLPGGL